MDILKLKFVKIIFLFIVFLFSSKLICGQKFTFSIGYGFNNYSMNMLNKSYLDTFAIPNKIFNNNLRKGNSICAVLSYNIDSLIQVGISYTELFSKLYGKPEFIKFYNNEPPRYFYGKSILNISSRNIGISPSISISKLLNRANNDPLLLKNINLSFNFDISYGFSKFRFDFYSPNDTSFALNYSNFSYEFKGQGFSFTPSLNLEYALFKSHINIGLVGGYRYYSINSLKDIYNNKYTINEKDMKLEFNGFFILPHISIRI